MTFVRESVVALTCNSSGESTGFTESLNGLLHSIHYVKASTANAFSTDIIFSAVGEQSGIRFLDFDFNSSVDMTIMPRGPIHNSSAGSTNAGGDKLPVAGERIKFTTTGGGNGKTGTFRVTVV